LERDQIGIKEGIGLALEADSEIIGETGETGTSGERKLEIEEGFETGETGTSGEIELEE